MQRTFGLLTGTLQVSIDYVEEPAEIVRVLSDAARLARERDLQSLLVISGADDPVTPTAVSVAIEEIYALGAPPPFRIAFVACMLPQYSAYHCAERYAQRFGILTKALVSIRDAKSWLGLREDAQATVLAL